MDTIGSRIAWIRESNGLNKVDFAKKIGVNQSTVSRIEDGIQKPSADTLIALSHIFNVSSDWILLGTKKQEEPTISESPPLVVDKELRPYFEKINKLYKDGAQKIKGWTVVQLEKAFPEIAEEIKKEQEQAAAADIA